ncbi:putative transposase [Devosia enhydra]|uniref:Putative transposase n=1 Tax=Devosia enhydra TaxID=665118 RepID=A0A1K2I1G9_9HYPH|nr:putative transposase [Devosia enhydra]
MKPSSFTEEQIIGVLKEYETGVPVAELCRKHGVSNASFHKWKAKYGGMDVSEARKLKALEDETLLPSLQQVRATVAAWRADYNIILHSLPARRWSSGCPS